MRRYYRLFGALCAVALALTACGGAGEEPPEGSPTLPDTQVVADGIGVSFASGDPDAPPVSGEPDGTSEPDKPPVSGEPDGTSAPDAPPVSGEPDGTSESDAPPVSVEPDGTSESDAPPVSVEPDGTSAPDEPDAQLSGELLPEVKAMGEGVSVGKLSYEVSPDSCTVYLPEGAQYVPFLVLSADYGGNALLLRRDVLPDFRPFNNYSAAYEDSAIDRFLNGEYLQRLDAVRDLIRSSEIVVTDADALGVSGTAVRTLTRNVFLLSCTETGFTDLANAGKEGVALSYFDAPEHRAARRDNGPAASWWLRTPDTYYLSAAYGVGPDGSLGSGNAYNENGVRPALCVPPDAQAFPTADIAAGQTVYFLSP